MGGRAWLPALSNPPRDYRDEREPDRLCLDRVPREEDPLADPRREPLVRDLEPLFVELLRLRELDPERDPVRVDVRPREPERPLELRERDPDERFERRRLRPVPSERWSLGISARTTARVSCGIRRSR